MIWKLFVSELLPSANAFLRLHWAARQRLSRDWYWLLIGAGAGMVSSVRGKRSVRMTRCASRLMDQANLWTPSDKCVLDNLVRMKLIKDDSPRWLDALLAQRVDKVMGTLIEIWEVK